MKDSVCVDFDGVIAVNDGWQGVDHFGELIPGAKEFLEELSKMYNVIIFTCRCTEGMNGVEKSHLLVNRVRDYMDEHELKYDEIWANQGKPIAKAYIDDRGVYCNPALDSLAYAKVLLMLGAMEKGE